MKKLLVEFIGTFFLVTGAILFGAVGASLALMVMVYAGGHISGAHYNPAVTVAMFIRRKIKPAEMTGYFIAQFAGGIVAGVISLYIFQMEGRSATVGCDPAFPGGALKPFVAELLGTFALAYVVLNVATSRATANNSFYGIAIGGTLLAMALAVGQFSGGVINPAVGVGLALQKTICWNSVWLYFVAPVAGGALAAITFLTVNEAEDEPESIPDDREVAR